MLSGTVETEGTFYYSRPGRICMLFDHPKGDLLLISNGTIKSVTGGHTTVASSARNPAIRQVNDMITSCMTGAKVAISGCVADGRVRASGGIAAGDATVGHAEPDAAPHQP